MKRITEIDVAFCCLWAVIVALGVLLLFSPGCTRTHSRQIKTTREVHQVTVETQRVEVEQK